MFKVAIIGLGAIGQRLIKDFSSHPETNIVAVCDTMKDHADQTAKSLGDIQAFNDHKEMLEQVDLDLVYVAVPPKFHHAVVSDVMEKGIHVLCEKPLANSIEEAESLYKKAEEKGIIHSMNFPLNYSAGSKTFAKLIGEGYVGGLRRLELKMHFPQWPRAWQQNAWVASREQGGFVLEVGIHFIQQIQKIFGPVKLVHRSIQFPQDPASCEIGIMAYLQLEDGTPLVVDGLSGIAGKEEIRLSAYGTKGTLSLLNWGSLEGGKVGEEITSIESDANLTDTLLNNVVKKLKGKPATIIDFKAGYDAQVILEQLRSE
ncbi:Gfo/Idh/MocA family protein [Peribacillus alkalitolerans]|uniref:Gfo/Idh/MocA family protein n=1 Tax=Peribacillus alkalitolerans TaxID=1550385 RepID=UPI0013D244FF|nr:Gfo/Idh/MocA family oxidoreductase [Peribacillus alkalitolerans]